MINAYQEKQSKLLTEKYTSERKGLIADFRQHFRDYNLSEESIFAQFNKDIEDTVAEKNILFGPSKPKFITNSLADIEEVVNYIR